MDVTVECPSCGKLAILSFPDDVELPSPLSLHNLGHAYLLPEHLQKRFFELVLKGVFLCSNLACRKAIHGSGILKPWCVSLLREVSFEEPVQVYALDPEQAKLRALALAPTLVFNKRFNVGHSVLSVHPGPPPPSPPP